MCGITGIHFKEPTNRGIGRKKLDRFVNELLLGIENRGKDATGLVCVTSTGETVLTKRDVPAKTFVTQRKRLPSNARTILGHTRFATQGTPDKMENNHPVQYRSCYAIHNGHISNDSDLFKEFSLERQAEVDSEIIPALFDKFGLDKAHLALQQLEGNMAVAVVDPERYPGQLVLAKGWSSPLFYIETPLAIVWASTLWTIQDAARKALDLQIKPTDIESLETGELLYVDGSSVEKMNFEVKTYYSRKSNPSYGSGYSTYTNKSSSSGYGFGKSATGLEFSSAIEARRWSKECANCGHTGMWHGAGRPYGDGACFGNAGTEHARKLCLCEDYVEVLGALPTKESSSIAYDWCDGCHVEMPMSEMSELEGGYLLCKANCLQALVNSQKPAEASFDEWEERENLIHAETLKLVARSFGERNTKFIEWLLFEAPDKVFEDNSFLVTKHAEFESAYWEAEIIIRGQIDDIIERAQDKELATGGLVKASNVVSNELEEATQHLVDMRGETDCGVEVFDGELVA